MRDDSVFKLIKKYIFGDNEKFFGNTGKLVQNISRNGIKDCFSGDDSLSIRNTHVSLKENINKKARTIIKKSIDHPDVLLKFIQSNGTAIVKSRHMEKILKAFGEAEGFITPMCGVRALLFTLIINILSETKLEVDFKTPALFALKDEPVNIYTMSHQFHLWLSYINKLPGFDSKNMQNFRKYWNEDAENQDISRLSIEEVLSLSDLIAREMEALDFVREIGREFIGQRSSLKKLKNGNSVNI